MDLNSTGFSSDVFAQTTLCNVLQCHAGVLKNGWNGGILVYDYNQGLSVCRWDGSVCRMGWNGGILIHD